MREERCLTDADLIAVVFDGDPPDSAALQHIAENECCEDRLVRLLHAAHGITVAAAAPSPDDPCLSEWQLAQLAQGEAPDHAVLSHVAGCAGCSRTLAAVIRLLDDSQVRAELEQVERRQEASHRRTTIRSVAGPATLAAALLAGLLLRPHVVPDSAVAPDAPTHRQSASANAIVPRIVTPAMQDLLPDTLRWTSVPFADRYQVIMFDREGTLVWETQTRDTAIALPQRLRTEAAAYMWKVEARTDWNRWVASEWVELATPRRP